jgi:hypothetical protein
MDDWVIIAPSRWKLRKAVRVVNQTLSELRVEQHPDKTFIGRAERGISFLGHHLTPDKTVAPSAEAIRRLAERIARLYEQGADMVRIGQYVRRWAGWLFLWSVPVSVHPFCCGESDAGLFATPPVCGRKSDQSSYQ